MRKDTLPLFKSHYSIGKSILTLEKEGGSGETEPKSIIDLSLKHGIKKVFLIEDSMSGFLEAYTNCKKAKLQLVYGLRVTVCQKKEDLSEESRKTESKYVVVAKNTAGYEALLGLYTDANLDGFYYTPRTDFDSLREIWNDDDLQLCVPFYDSFLYKNALHFSECVPDFSFAKPTFFLEDNSLWLDILIRRKVEEYCGDQFPQKEVRSIYYESRDDFLAFTTFKCIGKRSRLDKPEMDHFSSDEFCISRWLEETGLK